MIQFQKQRAAQDEELMAMQKKIECIFTAEQMMNEGVDLDYITEVYL